MPGITVDFYYAALRIAFEIDGKVHVLREKEDALRVGRLKAAGYKVIRIPERSILKSPSDVADFIRSICTGEVDISSLEGE